MLIVLPIINVLIVLVVLIREVLILKKFKPSHWMMFISIMYYPVYQIVYFLGLVGPSKPFLHLHDLSDYYHFFASVLVLLFFISFLLGRCVRLSFGVYINDFRPYDYKVVVFLLLTISFISFISFVQLYGGLGYVFEYAANIRSGTDPNKSYLGAFFRMFTYYLEFSFYAVISVFLIKGKRILSFSSVVVLGLFFIVAAKLMLDSGRSGFISLFVGVFFVYCFIRSRVPILASVVVSVLAFFILVYGKVYIFPLFTGVDVSVLDYTQADRFNSFFVEFAHPYFSTLATIVTESSGERIFGDFFYWILKPLKLLGVNVPDSVSYFNTYIATGDWDSMIPPGGVAFALQQGGYFFVPVFGFICGIFYNIIDDFVVRSIYCRSPVVLSFCVVLTMLMPGLVVSSDIALIIQASFVYLVLFFILLVTRKFRLYVHSNNSGV